LIMMYMKNRGVV